MDFDVWRDVKGYEGMYQVSSCGGIKSLNRRVSCKKGSIMRTGRSIKVRLNNFGYLETRLCKDGHKKTAFLHRVIAEAFIPNPQNKPDINHRSGIKTDNRLCNLEWCTASENAKHAILAGLRKLPLKMGRKVIDTTTGQTYSSIREAAKAKGMPYVSFKNALHGVRKNTTGLRLLD